MMTLSIWLERLERSDGKSDHSHKRILDVEQALAVIWHADWVTMKLNGRMARDDAELLVEAQMVVCLTW